MLGGGARFFVGGPLKPYDGFADSYPGSDVVGVLSSELKKSSAASCIETCFFGWFTTGGLNGGSVFSTLGGSGLFVFPKKSKPVKSEDLGSKLYDGGL